MFACSFSEYASAPTNAGAITVANIAQNVIGQTRPIKKVATNVMYATDTSHEIASIIGMNLAPDHVYTKCLSISRREFRSLSGMW